MTFKLTRERVILGGLMLSAGVGLMVDRFVFAAPPTEDAASVTSAEPAMPDAGIVTNAARAVTSAPTRSPDAVLAARLAELAGSDDAAGTRDVFNRPRIEAGDVARGRVAVPFESTDAYARWQRRILTAVLLKGGGKSVAVVDGRVVPIGSTLDGLRLVRLTSDSAVFTDGTNELTLRPAKNP